MSFYHRNLPHWQPEGAEFFITFQLPNSLPTTAIERIKSKKESIDRALGKDSSEKESQDKLPDQHKRDQLIFKKYEQLLDQAATGPTWLSKPSVADIVCEAIHHRNNKKYNLYAYCIMPNHVHLVFKLLKTEEATEYPVTKILQSLKRFTARNANKILNRKGQFWQHESFDRVIRNAKELESTIKYVLNNPVKARLVKEWQDWPYSFCKPEFKNELR